MISAAENILQMAKKKSTYHIIIIKIIYKVFQKPN